MYSKNTWLPRLGTGLNKFTNTGTAQNLELTPAPDSVIQEGTPFSADRMNALECGMLDAQTIAGGVVLNAPAGNAETFSAGDVVDIINERVYAASTLKILTASAQYAWLNVQMYSICKLTDLSAAIVYIDAVDNSCKVIIATVIGVTVSYSAPVLISAAPASNVQCAALAETSFVVTYCTGAAGSSTGVGYVTTCSVNSGSVTVGVPTQFAASIGAYHGCAAITASSIAIVYRDESNYYYGTAVLCSVTTSGTVTVGSAVVFETTASTYPCVVRVSDSQIAIAFTDGAGAVSSIVGTIGSGVLTFGAASDVPATAVESNTHICILSDGKLLISWYNSTNSAGYIVAATIANGVLSYGNPLEYSDTALDAPEMSSLDGGGAVMVTGATVNGTDLSCFAKLTVTSDLSITVTVEHEYSQNLAVQSLVSLTPKCLFGFAPVSGAAVLVLAPLPRAIALAGATAEVVPVAYSGNVFIPDIAEGTQISSDGVTAFAYAPERLAVRGWWTTHADTDTPAADTDTPAASINYRCGHVYLTSSTWTSVVFMDDSIASPFNSVPHVVLTPCTETSGVITAKIKDRTRSGFKAIIGGSISGQQEFDWIAIE